MHGHPATSLLRPARLAAWLLLAVLSAPSPAAAAAGDTFPGAAAVRFPPAGTRLPMAGVCLAAPGRNFSSAHLDPLVDNGARWISLTPFGWQRGVHSPRVAFATGSDHMIWGESDEGLGTIARAAHARGQSILLSPHIWLMGSPGKWRGDIEMREEEDWRQWFETYRAFILHYARLAQKEKMEMLSVGLELTRTTLQREDDWRRLIRDVRRVYDGLLTYSANWYQEPESIRFWDALDFVGIQAYFPLGNQVSPDLAALQEAWSGPLARLQALAAKTGKRIVFTEVGYKSSRGGTAEPWLWRPQGPVDLDLQVRAYEALFDTFWNKPWFAGAFIWKWHVARRAGGSQDGTFTPQGKPALAVMKRFFMGAANKTGEMESDRAATPSLSRAGSI
ncbi:MAG: hypothetical protein ACE5ID_00395 [Acidobacteriota bacterium]